jgi:hypothetical protein
LHEQQRVYEAANSFDNNNFADRFSVAVGSLQQQLVSVQDSVRTIDSNFSRRSNNFEENVQRVLLQQKEHTDKILGLLIQQTSNFSQFMQQHLQQQQSNNRIAAVPRQQQRQPNNNNMMEDESSVDLVDLLDDDGTIASVPPTEVVAVRQERDSGCGNTTRGTTNALQALLVAPRVVPLGEEFPTTWTQFLRNWVTTRAASFIHARKTTWPQNIRLRFSKHLGTYQQLARRKQLLDTRRRNTEDEYSLEITAITLETERVGRKVSLTQHVEQLKKEDNNVTKRRKTNNNNTVPIINNNITERRNNNNSNSNTVPIENNINNNNNNNTTSISHNNTNTTSRNNNNNSTTFRNNNSTTFRNNNSNSNTATNRYTPAQRKEYGRVMALCRADRERANAAHAAGNYERRRELERQMMSGEEQQQRREQQQQQRNSQDPIEVQIRRIAGQRFS